MRGIIFVLMCVFLTGCGSLISWPSRPPPQPQKLFKFHQSEKTTPRVVGAIDGDPVIAYETEKIYSTDQQQTTPTLTTMQIFGRWVSGLTWISVIFILVSLLLCGGFPIIWLVKKYLKIKSALKNTVAGIRDLMPDAYMEVTESLSKTHDKEDKIIIDKIKSELH